MKQKKKHVVVLGAGISGLTVSYFLNKSQTHYYGVKISKGLNTPDLHGTLLLIWGISMISKIIDLPTSNWNILKP